MGVLVLVGQSSAGIAQANDLTDRLLVDLDDGCLDQFPLFDAALIASGVTTEEGLDYYEQRLAQICEILAVDPQASPAERSAEVLAFLHQWILTGSYSTHCTELDRTLEDGHYNCVSATILYMHLCMRVGLEPRAMATAEHVYCRFADGIDSDVETTFSDWFSQPISARALLRASRTAAAGPARRISSVQLVAKVYYNIGVTRLEKGDFRAAVEALRLSIRLDPQDRSARENLLAALNNWALRESDAGRYDRATELLNQVGQLDPDYGPSLANDLHVHQKWALHLCQAGEFREALELLDHCYARRPDAELYDLGRFAVCSLWAQSLLCHGQQDRAWEVFAEARRRYPQRSEWSSYEEEAIHRSVTALLQQGNREDALALSLQGIRRRPDSERLRRQHHDLTRPRS
jgi:tetratricopeptide (TPR) repeat protein